MNKMKRAPDTLCVTLTRIGLLFPARFRSG